MTRRRRSTITHLGSFRFRAGRASYDAIYGIMDGFSERGRGIVTVQFDPPVPTEKDAVHALVFGIVAAEGLYEALDAGESSIPAIRHYCETMAR